MGLGVVRRNGVPDVGVGLWRGGVLSSGQVVRRRSDICELLRLVGENFSFFYIFLIGNRGDKTIP